MLIGVINPAGDPVLCSDSPLICSWGEVVFGHRERNTDNGGVKVQRKKVSKDIQCQKGKKWDYSLRG